jgi:hypothetical protein
VRLKLERDRQARSLAVIQWLNRALGNRCERAANAAHRPAARRIQLSYRLGPGQLSRAGLPDDGGFRAHGERGIVFPVDRPDSRLPFGEVGKVGRVREDFFGRAEMSMLSSITVILPPWSYA